MGESPVKEIPSEPGQLNADILQSKDDQEYLVHLLHVATEGLMMIGRAGRIIFVNKALEQIVGYKSADMIGKPYDDSRWRFHCNDDNRSVKECVLKGVFETGTDLADRVCRMETEKGKSGIFILNTSIHRDAGGTLAGVAVIIRDATEISRVKAENDEIKKFYKRLAQYSDDAIFRIRADSGHIVYINDTAEKILGYSLDDYQSDVSLQQKIFTKSHLNSWVSAMGESLAAKDVLKNIVMECNLSDGRTVVMDFTVIAVRNEKGVIDYFECLGRDETVKRFMEAELARAQKLESIGLLAGGIAHDFNNLLTAIFGSVALAKMDALPDSPIFKRLTSAEEHCMKAKALTRRLLTYSRGGSPQRKTASIAKVIREAVHFTLSGKNVDCRFSLPEGLWSAQIDEGQMFQVVHSLVSNACEAMAGGGTLDVGAENVEVAAEQIPSLEGGSYVKWYVRDYGVGITEYHLKKIFDPYFTTKQMGSVKGVGLGLAICYSVVKSHDGVITVESTPGVGTLFTVYIPAASTEKEDVKPAEVKNEPAEARRKILLVDDEQILLDTTGGMLTYLGYDVMTAKSHATAIADYSRAKQAGQPVSLVIMDLTMRGDEGGEVAIRRWKTAHPEVRAVISSGYMNDPVIEEYWKYGFVGAMIKPYSLTELKGFLDNVLAGSGN